MTPLDPLLEFGDHVVAQVVESELIIRAVGHVGGVGLPSGDRAQLGRLFVAAVIFGIKQVGAVVRNHANREAHEGEDRAHPACIAAGKVVVHGHHMHTTATNGVDGGTERTNERLPFAGAHLRDLSLM